MRPIFGLMIVVVTICYFYMLFGNELVRPEPEINHRGVAIAAYLLEHHQQVVDPEQAQYLNIQLNTFNLTVKDMDIFLTKIMGDKKK